MTKNFKLKEFECKGKSCGNCNVPDKVYFNLVKVANQLQWLRDYLGKPIKINSGYRCPSHNEASGGVKLSKHTLGMASDISVKGVEPEQVLATLEAGIQNGDVLQGGLGLYDTFVHYDIRGSRARWDYRKK
tara:strand:+ start:4563 stop:4955 length:393 start_codon:yes stop_codon:yes gene_type:complete